MKEQSWQFLWLIFAGPITYIFQCIFLIIVFIICLRFKTLAHAVADRQQQIVTVLVEDRISVSE